MRNLQTRIIALEDHQRSLLPRPPSKIFIDPVEAEEYQKLHPGAFVILLKPLGEEVTT